MLFVIESIKPLSLLAPLWRALGEPEVHPVAPVGRIHNRLSVPLSSTTGSYSPDCLTGVSALCHA